MLAVTKKKKNLGIAGHMFLNQWHFFYLSCSVASVSSDSRKYRPCDSFILSLRRHLHRQNQLFGQEMAYVSLLTQQLECIILKQFFSA
jgi:hypothetical protein